MALCTDPPEYVKSLERAAPGIKSPMPVVPMPVVPMSKTAIWLAEEIEKTCEAHTFENIYDELNYVLVRFRQIQHPKGTTMAKATCYEAVVIVHPTEKERKEGEIGHIVANLEPFLAMSEDSARSKAINAASVDDKELDRVEVLLRPFG